MPDYSSFFLVTQEGNVEPIWLTGCIQRWFTHPQTVTHRSTNWAECRASKLNMSTSICCQPYLLTKFSTSLLTTHRVYYSRSYCHNALHPSSFRVIFLSRMHTNRLFQSFRHHQPCNTVHFQKLGQLDIPSNVLLFIINFLSGRTQAVSSFGQTSSWLPVAHFSKHTRIQYWPLSLHGLCVWSTNSVAIQCHHQIWWRHYITCWPTQLSWHLPGIWSHLFLVCQKQAYHQYQQNKKLFFIGLPLGILIFRLLFQTLNEYLRLH